MANTKRETHSMKTIRTGMIAAALAAYAAFGQGGFSGANPQTANYTAGSGDSGKLVLMNGPSLTLTLPAAAPAPTWWVAVQNLHTTALAIAANGRTINGRSANITLQPYQQATIYTDGANYFANPPWVCGDGLRLVATGASFTCTVDSAVVASRSTAQSGIDTLCAPRGNSGTNYTCAPATVVSAYTAYSAWRFVPDVNSAVNPTVNMWALGPLTLKKSLNGTLTNLAANELRAGVSYIMVLGAGTPPSTALILPAVWAG
jgi:hypothetical protein